jgi:uncharacterized phiE125 gp8 family phage protein
VGLVLLTPPESHPVSLADAKLHVRCDAAEDDALLSGLITAATRWCEKRLDQQFMEAEWALVLDCFPRMCGRVIELPRGPLVSVDAVKYYDAANDLQTLSDTKYDVDTSSRPGRIAPVYGESWPITRPRIGAVQIEFTAGHGDADDVPQTIKQAILLLVGHWYAHREAVGTVTRSVEFAVDSLLGVEWDGSHALLGIDT